MADVVVTVMVDGKQIYAHAVAGAPVAGDAVIAGLQQGLSHFSAMKFAGASQSVTGNQQSAMQNATPKGPTL